MVGVAAVVAGVVMRVASHLPHAAGWLVVAGGVMLGWTGLRLDGRP